MRGIVRPGSYTSRMATLRRFLLFQAFAVWQGGFLFYAAVVVPVATDVLGSPALQGDITRPVSDWMNLLGLPWAGLYLWDTLADPDRGRRRIRAAGWLLAVELLAVLALLHLRLDALYDADGNRPDRAAFRTWHAAYLWTWTAEWLLGLVLAWLAVRAWAYNGRFAEDRR